MKGEAFHFDQVIGIHIEKSYVQAIRISRDGNLLKKKTVYPGMPLMPGYMTLLLCNLIQEIDPAQESEKVFIILPGDVNEKLQVFINNKSFPRWLNVPLADWIEVRLNKKVFIENCQAIKDESFLDWVATYEEEYFFAYLGAYRGFKYW